MTTFLNLIATEPEIARVPIMIDSSNWDVIEAGPEVRPGQGRRQLDQPEGGRGRLPREGAATIRRYGAAVVVMALRRAGPGRHGRAQGRDLRARVPAADRARPGFDPDGHHLRPEHPRDRDRASRSTTTTRRRSSRRRREIKRRCPGVAGLAAASRTCRFSFRGNDARARGDALGVPLPRDRGGARHGHRQRRPARRLRGHPEGPARARRGHHLQPPSRRDRAPGDLRRDGQGRRGRSARTTSPGARAPSRSASRTRSSTASSTSSRRTPRRRAAATTGRSR